MPSVSPSQLPALARKVGYDLMLDASRAMMRSAVFPRITSAAMMSDATAPLFGHSSRVMVGIGQLDEIEVGVPLPGDSVEEGFRSYSKIRKYGKSLGFPKEILASDQGEQFVTRRLTQLAPMWGRAAILAKEKAVARVFLRGVIAAGDATVFNGSHLDVADNNPTVIYDGQPLFSTAHVLYADPVSGRTFSNFVEAVALSEAALRAAHVAMTSTNALDERGERVAIMPTQLMVPPNIADDARVLLSSTLLPASPNNDANVLQGRYELVENPYITELSGGSDIAEDMWTLLAPGALTRFDSGDPEIETWYSPGEQSFYVGSSTYLGVHINDWRSLYAGNKASS